MNDPERDLDHDEPERDMDDELFANFETDYRDDEIAEDHDK